MSNVTEDLLDEMHKNLCKVLTLKLAEALDDPDAISPAEMGIVVQLLLKSDTMESYLWDMHGMLCKLLAAKLIEALDDPDAITAAEMGIIVQLLSKKELSQRREFDSGLAELSAALKGAKRRPSSEEVLAAIDDLNKD